MPDELTSTAPNGPSDPLTVLRCPFCGVVPSLSVDEFSTIIECNNPECLAPSWCEEPGFDGDGEHSVRAIARWNRRTGVISIDEHKAKMRQAVEETIKATLEAQDEKITKAIAGVINGLGM